ncbi:hypothetical protein ACHAWF_012356 [Thalassiosira exigua]
MKISAALAVAAVGGASAYSVNRSTLRNLGQRSVGNNARAHVRSNDIKMEDFGLFKGTLYSFDDTWVGAECISEVGLEKALNKEGLRYKMNKTPEEAAQCEPLLGLPGFTVNLPLIGETYLGPPRVDSIWEALGFTATSNNEARQAEKMKAIEKARTAKTGVLGGEGETIRSKWLEKYGYPRLVGSGGIFYADQLSTDKEAMGGFNMGKSGTIWPVPENVAEGQYGGKKGWGMKKAGPAVDNLPKVDM